VIDLLGQTHYAKTLADLPPMFTEVAQAYATALEEGANFSALKQALRDRDILRIKEIWDPLVKAWDERTFYDFVASSEAFQKLSFHHREVFGQVGFGTGGWDSDFPNSMLEILRVNVTECDDHQRYIIGGAEQVPRKLWTHCPDTLTHWPTGTTLASLNGGATRSGAVRIRSHILGDPITVSWEADENFLGAFKGALPGHYRYNHRMFGHFMQQNMPPEQQGIFIAGDGVSWTPAWVEGAVQTSLNAVSGIIHHFGGASHPDNLSPRDTYVADGPLTLQN
jgi:hypothetical protein